jgi:GT2 family glycosyltransferase
MVSLIIPNWNGEKFLKGCLEAVRRQTLRNFEVFVVDNASSDSSRDKVREFFPEAQVIALAHNFGFAGAANAGMARAKGEFIALLNNDAIPEDRWLEELLSGIRADPGIGFCASKILQVQCKKRIDAAGDAYAAFGAAFPRGLNRRADEFNRPGFVFGACAAAALYRRSMLARIGGFDEDLFFAYEDVDLSFRAQLAGYKCLYIPTAVVYHFRGGTAGKNNEFTRFQGQRNLETVFFKNMPSGLLVKYFPLHMLYILMAFFYNLIKGGGGWFLRSKWEFLREIRVTFHKRKVIQRSRRVSLRYLEEIFDSCSLGGYVRKKN